PVSNPGVRIWYCPQNSRHTLQLLDGFFWMTMHWRNNRAQPCFECWNKTGQCDEAPLWKGYAPAQLLARNMKDGLWHWTKVVLQITGGAGQQLRGHELPGLFV